MKLKNLYLTLILCFFISSFFHSAVAEDHVDAFTKALTGGKADVTVRYRYENVSVDNNGLENADAQTIRTAIGYRTGDYYGFSVYGQLEDVRDVFGDDFNSTRNGNTRFEVVPDPDETELNQLYIQFAKAFDSGDVLLRHGRQSQKWDNDRFIGNVGWRQNEQTYDALLAQYTSQKYGLTLQYSHQTNVNRIFGEESSPNPALDGDFDVTNNNFRINYTGIPYLNATAYYYLWNGQEDAGPLSDNNDTKTLGTRLLGTIPLGDSFTLIANLEYASQDDHQDATSRSSLDYSLIELGGKFKLGGLPFTVKASLETLEGDGDMGGTSFVTPFATIHAFQGWADVFLAGGISGNYGGFGTGIEDLHFRVKTNIAGINMMAVYHEFEPEDDSDANFGDYGSEFNFVASKKFKEHYLAAVKYADYSADTDVAGFASEDKRILWAWFQAKF